MSPVPPRMRVARGVPIPVRSHVRARATFSDHSSSVFLSHARSRHRRRSSSNVAQHSDRSRSDFRERLVHASTRSCPDRTSRTDPVGRRLGRTGRPGPGTESGAQAEAGSRGRHLAGRASVHRVPDDLARARPPEPTVIGTSRPRRPAVPRARARPASRRTETAAALRAPVVAAPFASSGLATASFMAKIALALERAAGGINHGTARDVLDSSRASGEHLPITQSTVFSFTSSRVTPSRQAALSPTLPRAKPSRSDRISEGCTSREDQGGPQ
jgi:hypothetical protein